MSKQQTVQGESCEDGRGTVVEQRGGRGNDVLERRSLKVVLIFVVTGLATVPVFGLQAVGFPGFASIVAVGVATAGAAFLIGSLIGFLFGIPRRLQQEPRSSGAEGEEAGQGADGARRREREPALYGSNTNLEQISDWLTKILVGVGLVEIKNIKQLLVDMGDVAASGLGGVPGSSPFAVTLILYFCVSGFLVSYLLTRLYLGRALTEAERVSLERQLSTFERQSQSDALALQLATRQLEGGDAPPPTAEQLQSAIKASSRQVRAQIFYRAQLQRWRNWSEAGDKVRMERTIPIFRALVASDTLDQSHENHGQLGYALKDQSTPDWAEAEAELSRAIAIRADSPYWRSYEFNRALCRIHLDENFARGKPSTEEARERIEDDLREAAEEDLVGGWIETEPTITKWLKINKVDLEE